jgi:general L-amino acid transport system substrate-binding protein
MPIRFIGMLAVVLFAAIGIEARAGERLDTIRERGYLTCGVSADAPGLSRRDARGRYNGFEADVCRAVATAIFGSADNTEFRAIDTIRNFLADPGIDLVLHGLTWTFARETESGVRFGPVVLYDGQTFLVNGKLGIKNLRQLSGRTVCVQGGSNFYGNLQRAYRERRMVLKAMALKTFAAAEEAFFAGRCDAFTADATELAAALIGRAPNPDDYAILPDRISKEPLAPLLRRGDEEFFDIVRWTFFALVEAEELGVTARNVDRIKAGDDAQVRDFLSTSSTPLGLGPGWAAAVVRGVGNYGEMFERNLGGGSAARLDRGLNGLWSRGGLLYAPPLR